MKRSILMLSSILALFSCKGQQLLDVDSFSRMLEENDEVQLVDVRTPEEFADGHLALAANIDWKGSGFIQKAESALD
ncbi:MAG: rhodanese-like domain-containing protein, partial [Bacteroidales bacterium]|nr:rhodanese-like domain-containing protein [Bacteroidales bacterium]